jgi:hypothetical protein
MCACVALLSVRALLMLSMRSARRSSAWQGQCVCESVSVCVCMCACVALLSVRAL